MKADESKYTLFGKKYLGPFLYAYVSWLYENLIADNNHKVFFLARDGYLMEKAFNIFMTQKHMDFESQYVYFSRKSVRQTMLWRCNSYKESLKYLSSSKLISMGGILEYWGFSQAERQALSKQHNISLLEEFYVSDLPNNVKIESLYSKLKELINRKSKEQDVLLQKYVEQIGMLGNCAIVDIGWGGRLQQYIEKYFEYHNIPLNCNGYYLGIQAVVPLKGSTKGFLYDNSNLKLRKATLAFLGGYEKLFQSTEGSTCGYCERDGLIYPIFSTYEYEGQDKISQCIQDWQNAALDYVKESLESNLKADISMAKPLLHIGQYPSLKDVELFSFFCNNDGNKEYFVSQKSLLHYHPRELFNDLYNSAWKVGFMKSVFKLPLPYYFIYWLMRK